MSAIKSMKQVTAGNRKRKRPTAELQVGATTDQEKSIEEEEAEVAAETSKGASAEVEPPKKRGRRRRVDTQKTASSSQQATVGPSTFNLDEIRQSRKKNALHILNEVFPAMVVRLRGLIERSKAAADDRTLLCGSGSSRGSAALTGGPSATAKKRKLVGQLQTLVVSANDLMRQHSELMKTAAADSALVAETDEHTRQVHEKSFKRKAKWSSTQFRNLSRDAEVLFDTHARLRDANSQEEADVQRRYLDEVRLILNHPMFDAFRLEAELAEGCDGDDGELVLQMLEDCTASDTEPPVDDTTDLIALVSAEMRKAIECSHDLKQWVELFRPPLDVETAHELEVRYEVIDIIDELVENGQTNVNYLDLYLQRRQEFIMYTMAEPLSIDRMRALETYDSSRAVTWRGHANRLAMHCELLLDFVLKNFDVLEQSKPRVDVAAQLYS